MDRDSHILPLESVRNPRDLGGFRAADGRRIKDRLLLRTGHLGGVSERDAAYLRDVCHLGWIFDFRTVQEIELLPDLQVGQARNIHLPAIDPDAEQQNGAAIPQEAFNDLETHLVHLCFTDGAKAMAKDMYPSLIRSEYTQLQYAAFFRMIIEKPDNGAVLWHCSQGKDRGGRSLERKGSRKGRREGRNGCDPRLHGCQRGEFLVLTGYHRQGVWRDGRLPQRVPVRDGGGYYPSAGTISRIASRDQLFQYCSASVRIYCQ